MDYYSRKRAALRIEAKRQARKSLIKDVLTVIVALPILWITAVLWLSI